MKPRWKQVALRAYGAAFSVEQVSESYVPAVMGDWTAEVRDSLLKAVEAAVVHGDQAELFSNQALEDLQVLRAHCRSPMEAAFVDETGEALVSGFRGHAAVEHGVEGALNDRVLRTIRQVEEHIVRRVPAGRATGLRQRLENALPGAGLNRLAKQIIDGSAPRRARPSKHDGIDEGVVL
jgi:hypothetical protein